MRVRPRYVSERRCSAAPARARSARQRPSRRTRRAKARAHSVSATVSTCHQRRAYSKRHSRTSIATLSGASRARAGAYASVLTLRHLSHPRLSPSRPPRELLFPLLRHCFFEIERFGRERPRGTGSSLCLPHTLLLLLLLLLPLLTSELGAAASHIPPLAAHGAATRPTPRRPKPKRDTEQRLGSHAPPGVSFGVVGIVDWARCNAPRIYT